MRKILFNEDWVISILQNDKLYVIDGGAKGKLFKPFDLINKSILTVIRFDPDLENEILKNDNEIVFNKGLWNKTETKTLNLAKDPSTSSLFDLDIRIAKQLEPLNFHNRLPEKKIEVPCCTIDEMCEELQIPFPDFIKLDIHGSEYEALEGANASLNKGTLGVLVETWTVPIHKGQKTHGDVESLLNRFCFYLFEQTPLIPWKRKFDEFGHKFQIGGYDSLYFIDLIEKEIDWITETKAIKFIALADLVEHRAFALQLASDFREKKILSELNFQAIKSFIS